MKSNHKKVGIFAGLLLLSLIGVGVSIANSPERIASIQRILNRSNPKPAPSQPLPTPQPEPSPKPQEPKRSTFEMFGLPETTPKWIEPYLLDAQDGTAAKLEALVRDWSTVDSKYQTTTLNNTQVNISTPSTLPSKPGTQIKIQVKVTDKSGNTKKVSGSLGIRVSAGQNILAHNPNTSQSIFSAFKLDNYAVEGSISPDPIGRWLLKNDGTNINYFKPEDDSGSRARDNHFVVVFINDGIGEFTYTIKERHYDHIRFLIHGYEYPIYKPIDDQYKTYKGTFGGVEEYTYNEPQEAWVERTKTPLGYQVFHIQTPGDFEAYRLQSVSTVYFDDAKDESKFKKMYADEIKGLSVNMGTFRPFLREVIK